MQTPQLFHYNLLSFIETPIHPPSSTTPTSSVCLATINYAPNITINPQMILSARLSLDRIGFTPSIRYLAMWPSNRTFVNINSQDSRYLQELTHITYFQVIFTTYKKYLRLSSTRFLRKYDHFILPRKENINCDLTLDAYLCYLYK